MGSIVRRWWWAAALLLAACGSAARLEALEITPGVTEVTEHLQAQVRATARWDDGSRRDVTAEAAWASQDEAIATVSAGLVQAGPPGATYLTAAWEGLQASARVQVLPAVLLALEVSVEGLEVDETTLAAGVTVHVTVLGTYSDGSVRDVTSQVAWSDDHGDEPVLVDLEGHLHAEAPAALTLRTTLDGVTHDLEVVVTAAAPVALALAGLEAPLPAGDRAHLRVFALLTDGTTADVTGAAALEVADPTVASLDLDATLLVLRAGTTAVEASYQGLLATATLQATEAVLRSITIAPPDDELEAGELAYFTATGASSDGSVQDLTRALRWSTTDPVVAIAYMWLQPGAILARLPGTVTIVALHEASGLEGRLEVIIERD